MCGIVGYIGEQASAPILMKGLKRLEYRGYDSAGLALLKNGGLDLIRREGNLSNLEEALDATGPDREAPPKSAEAGRAPQPGFSAASLGIGHTRWATHGAPSEANAHPHLDCAGHIAVAHNGIIENFLALRENLTARGHEFRSDTDSETIAHLIEETYSGDLLEAVREALKQVEGSFALAVISADSPGVLVGARKDSPLVVGIAEDGLFLASDIPAILDHTRRVVLLEDGEMAELTATGYKISSLDGRAVSRDAIDIDWDVSAAEKDGYEDFMLKEIHEQPAAVRETIRGRVTDDGAIQITDLGLTDQELKQLKKVIVIACGTSLHAGMLAKQVIERWVRVPVEVDCSSEFRYRNPILDDESLVVAITQSGETADTLAGVRMANERGAKTLAVTNVVGSTITRETAGVVYTHAGPEIGVAATKTLIAQMTALFLFGLLLAQARGRGNHEFSQTVEELRLIPEKIESLFGQAPLLMDWAETYHQVEDFLFLGRGFSYPVAMEGALKLKEISYIHAEGYPAGEMKHGPIALINPGLPILVLAPKDSVYEKIVSNIHEAKARGATVLAVATEGDQALKSQVDDVFYIPKTLETLSPLLSVVPLQLLSYYIAKRRDCNVDQPRNLAKSVTVE
jgi:glutamine---fructose-6-phosphate transaminase (isomerizing)